MTALVVIAVWIPLSVVLALVLGMMVGRAIHLSDTNG